MHLQPKLPQHQRQATSLLLCFLLIYFTFPLGGTPQHEHDTAQGSPQTSHCIQPIIPDCLKVHLTHFKRFQNMHLSAAAILLHFIGLCLKLDSHLHATFQQNKVRNVLNSELPACQRPKNPTLTECYQCSKSSGQSMKIAYKEKCLHWHNQCRTK